METDIIWILLFIGYAIGLIPIAYFGITGTWEMIEFKNRMAKHREEKIAERMAYMQAEKSVN